MKKSIHFVIQKKKQDDDGEFAGDADMMAMMGFGGFGGSKKN